MKHYLLIPFLMFLVCHFSLMAQPTSIQPIGESEFHFIEISGAGSLELTDYFSLTTYSNPLGKIFIPALGPAYLAVQKNFLFIHYPKDGKQINLKIKDDFLYVNGEIRSVEVNNIDVFNNWAKNIKKEDIRRLDGVYIDDKLSVNLVENSIRRLIDFKPDLTIMGKGDQTSGIYGWASPRLLFLDEGDLGELDVSNVEILVIQSDSLPKKMSNFNILVTKMRQLKYIVFGADCTDATNMRTLKKLRSIKGIFIFGEGFEQFDLLENYPEIEKFALLENNISKINTKNYLKNLPKLKWLVLPADSCYVFNRSDHLRNLTAIGFIGNYKISRRELQDIVSYNPNLQYIDLTGLVLPSLSSLNSLSNLEGITIKNFGETSGAFSSIKSLKYIGIGDIDYGEMEQSLQKIKLVNTYCPSCLVNKVGICLGSGWILLLFPMLLIAVLFYRKHYLNI